MARGNVTAVVGAQYGSEGKGAVVADLAKRGEFAAYVRTGGPNAGHTFYHEGRKWVSRSLPVGWIDPTAMLVIGPGAVLDVDLLLEEIAEVEAAGYDIRSRLSIDYRAGVVTDEQRHAEAGVHGRAHERIGSTGEGVGMHRMSRINRDALFDAKTWPFWQFVRAAEIMQFEDFMLDTTLLLDRLREEGRAVCLEGTQGMGLSVITGEWPYTTSADCSSAQLAADAGVSASSVVKTLLVARTFPIRVAGNSGHLEGETTWEQIGQPEETTTVTKKVRRVGNWDAEQVRHAVRLNYPCEVVLTFADYLWPEVAGVTDSPVAIKSALPAALWTWLSTEERKIAARFVALGTGPQTMVWL